MVACQRARPSYSGIPKRTTVHGPEPLSLCTPRKFFAKQDATVLLCNKELPLPRSLAQASEDTVRSRQSKEPKTAKRNRNSRFSEAPCVQRVGRGARGRAPVAAALLLG